MTLIFFARINGGGTDRWLFWYPHWHRGKTLIPKQSDSKIPVLDPDRRVDAKCFSVCSSAKVIFNLSQFFCFLFRTTDKMTQFYKPFWDVCSTFWCIQWEKTVFSLRQLPSVFLYPWLWKRSSTSILLWSSRVNHCSLFVGYWLFE